MRSAAEGHTFTGGGRMRKFFESGLAFMLVGLVSVVVGLLSGRPGLAALGLLWLVIAIAVRTKAKKQLPTPDSQRKDDAS